MSFTGPIHLKPSFDYSILFHFNFQNNKIGCMCVVGTRNKGGWGNRISVKKKESKRVEGWRNDRRRAVEVAALGERRRLDNNKKLGGSHRIVGSTTSYLPPHT